MRRLPARLSRYLRDARDGRGRSRGQGRRRPRSPDHGRASCAARCRTTSTACTRRSASCTRWCARAASCGRASWDEALDRVADGLTRARDEFGGESILPYSYMGTQGLIQGDVMSARVMNALGATDLERTICATAGYTGTADDARHLARGRSRGVAARALRAGVGLEPAVDRAPPLAQAARRAQGPGRGSWWSIRSAAAPPAWPTSTCAPLPGTDAALAMGMMRAVVDAGLQDEEWCRAHADGYDELLAALGGHRVERCAELCGVPAADRARGPRVRLHAARAAAPRRGRPAPQGRARRLPHDRLPAGAHRRLAPPRRRLLLHPARHGGGGERLRAQARGPAARAGAHDQHVAARRGAHRPRARPAGEGARVLELEPGGDRARPGARCSRGCAATTCSPWCSSSS